MKSQKSNNAPMNGNKKSKKIAFGLRSFSLKKSTTTDTFTIIKEIKAPKLMTEATNPKLKNVAETDTKPMSKILNVGVLYLG